MCYALLSARVVYGLSNGFEGMHEDLHFRVHEGCIKGLGFRKKRARYSGSAVRLSQVSGFTFRV